MTSIRPITELDIPDVQRHASDPAIADTANLPKPYPYDGASTWHKRITAGVHSGRQVVFAISNDVSEFTGVISLNSISRTNSTASLDYWIAKPYWGEGHATGAAKLAIQYAFCILGLQSLTSGCLKRNSGSIRVLEKCGFKFGNESLYSGSFPDRFAQEMMLYYKLVIPNAES